MYYYEALIASRAYHSKRPLTYHYQKELPVGSVVAVPMQRQQVMALVVKEVAKPSFATKEITSVVDTPPLPAPLRSLYTWLESYYPARSGTTLQLFLPSNLSKVRQSPQLAPDIQPQQLHELPPLTEEQQRAIAAVQTGTASSYLLHGETGSGKTRVYAELVRASLAAGRSALVLTPEIGLTSQLARQLELMLENKVFVIHSQLTPKQKRSAWKEIASTSRPVIITGTRSALFSPVGNVGLIVIDESHDDAYKQEQAPNYLTTRVAAKLASFHGAKLLLGSATPSVADYAFFQQKHLPIITMKKPAKQASEVQFTVVDIKDRARFGRSPYLSKMLIERIESALKNGEQSLVYLNRRGTARLVLCQNCGWESICPNCDISLTFHQDAHQLICHTCGRHERPPSTCPKCSSPDIFYKSIGTKALISHLQQLFPEAKIERYDTDQTKDKRLESRFEAIHRGEVDILVGTQMLGKGLDLPLLSVVGIVQADTSLLIPDFSAREKTYQQLHQIIGRVGRGHRLGFVAVQTYHPESKLVQYALTRNYEAFFDEEIAERERFTYPPFCFLLKLSESRKSMEAAESAAEKLVEVVKSTELPVQIIGPSPALKTKVRGNYHWQIVIKSKQRAHLLRIIDALPKTAAYNIDPVDLL